MKIKRIISLILCVVIAMLALVSCEENIADEAQKEQERIESIYKPVILPDVSLTLYIISDGFVDPTNHTAIDNTVKDKIQIYMNERAGRKFNTKIDIKYFTEEEYESCVKDLEAGVVLITGEHMLEDGFFTNATLADLDGYLTDAALIKKYGFATLNASFNKTNPELLAASRDYLDDGSAELHFIPNNRVMGSYSYVLINKNIACDLLNLNEDELRVVDDNTNLTAVAELKGRIQAIIDANPDNDELSGLIVDEIVRVVDGASYESRVDYESQGFICNVLYYPEVTKSEAAEAGFGVLKMDLNKDTSLMTAEQKAAYDAAVANYANYEAAAMEFIYLINSDKTVRNLLLYGVETIHYDIKNGMVVPKQITGDRVYKMKLEYTGDIFLAMFCNSADRDAWTEEMMNNGLKQNLDRGKAD